MVNYGRFSADHQAVAALLAGDAAAGADVDVVHSHCGERLRPPYVVAVVGVAAIDHDVARVEVRLERIDRPVDHGGRYH